MKYIVDCNTDNDDVPVSNKFFEYKGRQHIRKTTRGWHLCSQWHDGTSTWECLIVLQESNPVEVAEFAVSHGIEEEPYFSWWVPFTLKKRDRIISVVNSRYHKRTHRFGIEIPKYARDAKIIDDTNGNTYWQDAIAKKIKDVRITFKILRGDKNIHHAHQQIRCHLIFDVKMEDSRRKARYVAHGNMTKAPETLTYARVVSRESVGITITLAALNDLKVKTEDIHNTYLTAPVTEKI